MERRSHPFGRRAAGGFTLLELLVVLFLATLVLGLSGFFFVGSMPSSKLSAAGREMAAAIRYARAHAQTSAEPQTLTIDIGGRRYGMEGRPYRSLPAGIDLKVVDPFQGEIRGGTVRFVFEAGGGNDGGSIVLWSEKRRLVIRIDPVAGPVLVKG